MARGNSAQSRAERAWSEQARRDRQRRQVRTQSGRPRSTPAINIQIGGGRKRRGGRGRSRRRPGVATSLWGIVASLASLAAVLTQSLVAIVSALALLGVTAAVARIEARTACAGAPPPPRKVARSRASQETARRRGSSGTGQPRPRSSGSGGGSNRKCSEACQRSKKPKNTCTCQASDCKHGSKAGVAG